MVTLNIVKVRDHDNAAPQSKSWAEIESKARLLNHKLFALEKSRLTSLAFTTFENRQWYRDKSPGIKRVKIINYGIFDIILHLERS